MLEPQTCPSGIRFFFIQIFLLVKKRTTTATIIWHLVLGEIVSNNSTQYLSYFGGVSVITSSNCFAQVCSCQLYLFSG